MRIGDIMKMDNSQGEDFTVKIVDVFVYEGVEYAEVEPVGFDGFTREVPTSKLKNL
jgi:hypothetical protein